MRVSERLPLFWYRKRNNFGDLLSPLLFEWISGSVPTYSETSPKICALGSLLHFVGENDIVWGTGIRQYQNLSVSRNITVKAVRGLVTAEYLRKSGIEVPNVFSDPALLLPRFYSPQRFGGQEIAVAPHYNDSALRDFAVQRELPLINLLTDHPLSLIDEICRYEHIITSALHVLITCEVYGIPVSLIWNREPRLKYVDYFSSTGRNDLTQRLTDQFPLPIREKSKFPNLQQLLDSCPFCS